jgi:hypothetical protein
MKLSNTAEKETVPLKLHTDGPQILKLHWIWRSNILFML